MTYKPTLADAGVDLIRCVNSSFEDKNFETFFKNAKKLIVLNKNLLENIDYKVIQQCLLKSTNSSLEEFKRKEDLLTASSILLSYN